MSKSPFRIYADGHEGPLPQMTTISRRERRGIDCAEIDASISIRLMSILWRRSMGSFATTTFSKTPILSIGGTPTRSCAKSSPSRSSAMGRRTVTICPRCTSNEGTMTPLTATPAQLSTTFFSDSLLICTCSLERSCDPAAYCARRLATKLAERHDIELVRAVPVQTASGSAWSPRSPRFDRMRRCEAGTARRMCGKRRSNAGIATRASSRASGAPRQKCAPNPNET